jgi:DNA-binding NarL/FixJ family response regulator
MSKNPIRVAIQHRGRLLRETLAAYLSQQPEFTVVGMTAVGNEVAQLCDLRKPDIVVVEADAEPWDAATLATQLRSRHRRIGIVGIYDVISPGEIARLSRAGLTKLVDCSRGVGAVLAALKAPPSHVGLAPASSQMRGESLSERELDVLYLISEGCTLQEMSGTLSISPRTIENHKRRIFAKLGVHSQAHATASAVRLGLLRAPSSQPATRDYSSHGERSDIHALVVGQRGDLYEQVTAQLADDEIPVLSGDEDPGQVDGPVVVVLVDPDGGDWESVGDLHLRAVLVTTEAPDQADIATAVLRGVDAVVNAASVPDQLVSAFYAVRDGFLMLNAAQARPLIDAAFTRLSESRTAWPVELTPRERDILLSIDSGHSVRQTARQLGISARTVENHQSRLFRKLGVRNRAEALAVAHGLGLIDTAKAEIPKNDAVHGLPQQASA